MRTTGTGTTATTLYRYRCEICGQHGRGLSTPQAAEWKGARHAQGSHKRAAKRLTANPWTLWESTAYPHTRGAWTWERVGVAK